MRNNRRVIVTLLLTGMMPWHVQAQSVPVQSAPVPSSSASAVAVGKVGQPVPASNQSPQERSAATAESVPGGSISGTVMAPDGNVLVGALVTLVNETSQSQRTLLTDRAGYFDFTGLNAGLLQLTITAKGFAGWVSQQIVLSAEENHQVPQITLLIATTNTTVQAVFSGHDLAEEQMKVEEKQRVLGVFPNFYVSYVWKAEPLTTRQKFQLAFRTSIDPVTFLGTGAIAGIQQWDDDFSGYGQGAQGYAKRYGASYADGFFGVMFGGAIFPSILHQDPRYFYKGTGSITSRALYAISTVVICRGDNGRWQPNYSNVLGNLAAGGISNAYYPASDRGVEVTIDNALIGTAAGAAASLLQEFLLRKMSPGTSPSPNPQH